MKKKYLLRIFFLGAALLLTAGVRADIREAGVGAATREGRVMEEPTYVPGEILVRWKDWADGFSIQRAHSRRGAEVVGSFYATHRRERTIQRVRIREGQTVKEALREYRRNPLVAHTQPNYLFRMQTNDTRFDELWGLHNTGQPVGGVVGTCDADIDAPEAWGITTGSPDVIIAVIDTGVNYNHPELAVNMWENPGEFGGTPGYDDDGNNFIDDIHGWDFFDNDSSPMDFHGHGTHVAGTIAAAGNNAAGITGVMWDAQIMALKISGVETFAATSNIVRAINYAVAEGAHIINASWGGPGGVVGGVLYTAIRDAGVLFVAAAGNDNTCNDTISFFPANYDLPNIISVAATDQNDNLAWFSNFGATSVDVAAPGVSVLSTIPTFWYGMPEFLYDSAGFDAYPLDASPPPNWVNITNQLGITNTWAVTNIYSLSAPLHSFSDRPGVDYLHNLDSTKTLTHLAAPITHTKNSRYRLTFDIRYDIAAGDFFDIVVSKDSIAWEILPKILPDKSIIGPRSSDVNFVPHSFDLTKLVEFFRATGAHLGFGICSDASITGEGVYIDNLELVKRPILINPYSAANYSFMQGTSMAAPHVAGLAGLLLSRSSYLTVAQLKELIIAGVDPLGLPPATPIAHGRINAHRSLLALPPILSAIPPSLDFSEVTVGESRNLTFTVTNTGGGTLIGSASIATPFSIHAIDGIVGEGSFNLAADASATVTVRFSPTAAGAVTGAVSFTSNGGNPIRDVSGTGNELPLVEPPPMENGCFIATAAFGTPLAEEIEVLSRLRDEYLLTNESGQRFVAFYERHSPALAEFISEREWAKRLVRIALWPVVRIAELIVD